MTTIKDIAKITGKSVTTISKVINDYPDISDETKKKVVEVMKQENFRPNAIARTLSTSRSHSIGIFINFNVSRGLHHIFFHEILFGLEINLGPKGYDFVHFSDLKWKKRCNYLEKCRSRHTDGAILMGVPNGDNHIDELLKSDVPVVFLDVDIIGKNATYVSSDNVGGAKKAIEYLHGLGHKDIGMISGLNHTKPAQERFLGFKQAIDKLNIPYRSKWVLNTYFSEEGGHKAMKKLLKMPKCPTAVFCQSDSIAIGAIKAIHEAGYGVPEDISVIGFDDLQISNYIHPKLTTIKQDTYLMGEKAASLLEEMMKNPDTHLSPVILPTELIVRDSCAQR
ncbi:MAG: LacI family DNA-binding transcriptional regulator [Halanaerobiaceae bacterium]